MASEGCRAVCVAVTGRFESSGGSNGMGGMGWGPAAVQPHAIRLPLAHTNCSVSRSAKLPADNPAASSRPVVHGRRRRPFTSSSAPLRPPGSGDQAANRPRPAATPAAAAACRRASVRHQGSIRVARCVAAGARTSRAAAAAAAAAAAGSDGPAVQHTERMERAAQPAVAHLLPALGRPRVQDLHGWVLPSADGCVAQA